MSKYSIRMFSVILIAMIVIPISAMAQPALDDQAAQDSAAIDPVSAMTLDKILAAIKAPAVETFSGTLTAFDSSDLVIIDRGGSLVKVRLYGIDGPETGQPFFDKSKDYASSRYLNVAVEITILATDSLGIPVGLILNAERESLNHLLTATGMAWWDQRNAPKDALLRHLGADAISNGLGIFSDSAPLAPWDYRKSHEIEDFTYVLKTEKEVSLDTSSASKAEKESVKTLSKKGTMTENLPRSTATPSASTPAPAPGNLPKFDTSGQDIDPAALMLKHQPRIAKDASGTPLGLTASDVGAIPFASQLGFQEGDIISRVNGIAIESESQIMGLIPQFENVKSFQVQVLRNGQTITIPINVP